MKKLFVVLGVLLLTSCQLSLTTPSTSGLKETQTWSGNRLNDYLGTTLQWYQLYTYDSQGRYASYGHYNPLGTLLYSHAYSYIGTSSEVLVDAVFDSNNSLTSFDVYTYDSKGNKVQDSYYLVYTDTTGQVISLQHFEVWQYDTSGGPSNGVLLADALFNSSSIVTKASRYFYTDSSYPVQTTQVLGYLVPSAITTPTSSDLTLYSEVDNTYYSTISPGSLLKQVYGVNASVTPALAPSRVLAPSSFAVARAVTLSVPSVPASNPNGPSLLSQVVWPTGTTTPSWWKGWEYDNWGNTEVDFTPANIPTKVIRTFNDGTVLGVTGSSTLTTALTRDSAQQITQEAVSFAGTTLNTSYSYIQAALGSNNVQGYLVNAINLSGSALLVPLAVSLTYNSDNSPADIQFSIPAEGSSPAVTLGAIHLNYNSLASTPYDVVTLPGLDPVQFVGKVNSITAYLGNEIPSNIIATYTFTYNYDTNGSIKISAVDGSGKNTGYFLLLNSSPAHRVGFYGYDAKNNLLFQYSYQYPDPTAFSNYSGNLGQLSLNSAGNQVQQALNVPDESSTNSELQSLIQMILGKLGY